MDYTRFGNTGLKVSRLCLGMMTYGATTWRPWVLDADEAEPLVRQAVEAGINFFDTADAYSLGESERITGRLLKKFLPRDQAVVASKVCLKVGDGPNDVGLSRKHIFDSIDKTLHNLGMDHLDVYQIHRWDAQTPIEETMQALHDLVRSGRVRYLGASSMFAWQFAKAQHVAARHNLTPFVSMQNHYNLLYREEEREMIPQLQDMGVAMIPWSPLARGVLARQAPTLRAETDTIAQNLYTNPKDTEILQAVATIANKHGVSNAQVALAWVLSKPFVTAPIVGASKASHLQDAFGATQLVLLPEDTALLEGAYTPRAVSGHS